MGVGAKPPHLIGIVGGSCAGKTWLADRLHAIFGKESARLSLDDFYLDRSHLPPARRSQVNFDHPRAIDWKRVERVLKDFAARRSSRIPRYDFTTHGRLPEEPLISPKGIMIMDGLWLFRRATVRRFFDFKIFVKGSRVLCRRRRLARDVQERGRNRNQVIDQFERQTAPMFEKHVAPQERWADCVLESPPAEAAVQAIAEHIRKQFRSRTVSL